MQLTVGTGSTWSLRAWICSQLARIDVDINVIDLTRDDYKAQILQHSGAGLVPSLTIKNNVIHDSLAISEFFNERANGALYPKLEAERALARSLCAELHSGFFALRTQCPFTLSTPPPLDSLDDKINNELSRVESIFASAKLPFMFDDAGAVDAFYAILAYRLNAYGIKLKGKAGDYQDSLLNWSYLQQAIALAQTWE